MGAFVSMKPKITPPPPPVPQLTPELIAYLDHVFPDRCARPNMDVQAIWMEAGARYVVAHLKAQYERQQEAGVPSKVL